MCMAQHRLSEATKRRVRAGRMLLAGKRPAEVAAAVGVVRQTVYTWKARLDEGGIDALRAVPGPMRPAKLASARVPATGDHPGGAPRTVFFPSVVGILAAIIHVARRLPMCSSSPCG